MKIISPLLTFALLSAVRPARADTIYLKNGGKMKGTVTSQNSSEVVLDLGYGTITTEMSEIKKISRSAGKKSQADAKSLELK
jgi:hypothetical protein